MEIKETTDKNEWESFLLGFKEKSFLDSWNWGEFQKKEGNRIWRLGIYHKDLIGVALVILVKARRGNFLFIPHGPAIKIQDTRYKIQNTNFEILKIFKDKLKEIAKKEGAVFIRVAPILERNEENDKAFNSFGFKNAPIHIHPEVTWELDIAPKEEELLKGMRKTTRYLIRQGEKNTDIEIIKSKNISDLEPFLAVYKETAKRHNFTAFNQNYLKNELETFLPDDQIMIFLGKYKGEIVSSALFVFWQNTCFYHHSGSLTSKAPVSYLLQWEAIKEAKSRGCTKYNFWGIDPNVKDEKGASRSKHPWAGLSLFKMGFGGYIKEYVRTKDLPLSAMYWTTYFIETARRIKRHL